MTIQRRPMRPVKRTPFDEKMEPISADTPKKPAQDAQKATDFTGCAQSVLNQVPKKYQAEAEKSVPLILQAAKDYKDKDGKGVDQSQLAYILATAEHESRFAPIPEDPQKTVHWTTKSGKKRVRHAKTFEHPETEYFEWMYGDAHPRKQKTLGNRPDTDDAVRYRGRGFVQLTGRNKYEQLQNVLKAQGIDMPLIDPDGQQQETNPLNALKPEIATRILVQGMMDGLFTGKKLSRYVNDAKQDFRNARRVVNGTDKAAVFAKGAAKYNAALNGCGK